MESSPRWLKEGGSWRREGLERGSQMRVKGATREVRHARSGIERVVHPRVKVTHLLASLALFAPSPPPPLAPATCHLPSALTPPPSLRSSRRLYLVALPTHVKSLIFATTATATTPIDPCFLLLRGHLCEHRFRVRPAS